MDLETVSGDGFTIDAPQGWEASTDPLAISRATSRLFGVGPTLAERSLEIVERREIDVDVEGVEQATRVEVTHPAGDGTCRMKVLLLRTTEGPIWDARYGAPEADFDEALAEAVLGSFTLEGA